MARLIKNKYFDDFKDSPSKPKVPSKTYPNVKSNSSGSWKIARLKENYQPNEGEVGVYYIVFEFTNKKNVDGNSVYVVDAPEPPFMNGNGIDD